MSTGAVDLRRDGRAIILTLRRPDTGNALDQGLASAFADAVTTIVAEPTPQIVVLRAEGTQFCVGGDVHAVATASDPSAYLLTLAGTMHDALIALHASPHILVAVVQGAAAGAGLALALHADLVVASERAVFLSAYAGVGLTPDCGASFLLPRVVGPRRAAELALTGRVLAADEARDWGIVNVVATDDELEDAVGSLIGRLAAGSGWALARTRELIADDASDLRAHLDAELDGLAAQIALPDTRQRMHAFLTRSTQKGRQ